MINIFKRKTNVKDIESFELRVAELINPELPQIKESLENFKMNIYFQKQGIQIIRSYYPKKVSEIRRNYDFFELSGIYLTEKKTKKETEVKLYYSDNRLHIIKIDKPITFYRDFDFNSITKKELAIRNIKTENPDLKIVSKILSFLNKQQLNLLEIESTFEIEIGEKFYYPILDMEDGNYIAIDKKGKVYRLIHDHTEIVKEIFKNTNGFLEFYSGNKCDLEIYFK